jgi:hypothetical protein
MPAISPNTSASLSYSITGSKAFVVNSLLDFNAVPRTCTITYPDPVPAGLAIVLTRVSDGESIDLAAQPDDTVNSTDIGDTDPAGDNHRDVTVHRTPGVGTIALNCNIQDPSEIGVLDEHYELKVSATTAVNWTYAVDNPFNSNVIRLVCDPVAGYASLPPSLLEKELLTVTAQGAGGPLLTPTVVRNTNPANGLVLPAPVPTYKFDHEGLIAIHGLPSAAGTSQTYQLVDNFANPVPLPGVYAATPVTFTVDTVYPGIGGPAFLTGHGTGATAIHSRPQRVQLVLDRSGSMGLENRWDNAKTAARIFINFFGEFRGGVNNGDRIGVTVFEDNNCAFRNSGPAGPPQITDIVPLDTPAAVAGSDLSGPVFGLPGGCTPIGDGLFFGLKKLQALDGGVFPANVQFTVVLLTDGDENAGTIKIGPGAEPGNPKSWAVAKADPDISAITAASTDLNLFTIGLGSAPNHAVLNSLVAAGHFAAAFTVGTLIDQFATMFSLSQEANKLGTVVTAPVGPTTANAVYFQTSSAQRFGVALLKTFAPATVIDGIEIARYDGTTYQVENIVPAEFEGHFYLGVPDATAFGGGTATWRVQRFNGATAQPITLEDVFAFEDLHVKSSLAMDKKDYLTGEEMQLAVEIRHDFAPVRGATVSAVLDAPEEGIGTLLAGLDPDDVARQQRRNRDGKDRPRGRAALIEAVQEKYDWDGMPRCSRGPGLFIDGTDLLHDVNGDGIYTNTFAKVTKEGVYNWTLFASGNDSNGNPFSHRHDRSTLAAISVSRKSTTIRKETLKDFPPSYTAVKITITPQDDFKEKLGPGFDGTVIWAVRDDGVFEHVQKQEPAPVNTDGTYTRTVVFKRGERPTVRVSVNGVILPKIYLTHTRPPHETPDPETKA